VKLWIRTKTIVKINKQKANVQGGKEYTIKKLKIMIYRKIGTYFLGICMNV
jgi:hypothetical protein